MHEDKGNFMLTEDDTIQKVGCNVARSGQKKGHEENRRR